MLTQFISTLRFNFSQRISAKTGWGKNELMMEFEQALVETLARMERRKVREAQEKASTRCGQCGGSGDSD